MSIPGKVNGFDIEGLAVNGTRLLLGLRGWSVVLEIEVELCGDYLRLAPLDDTGILIRKHFLPLDGLGVRDLHFCGDDLFILAGPTMALDGEIRIYKWQRAKAFLSANRDPERFDAVPFESAVPRLFAICPWIWRGANPLGWCCTTLLARIASRVSISSIETCCDTNKRAMRGGGKRLKVLGSETGPTNRPINRSATRHVLVRKTRRTVIARGWRALKALQVQQFLASTLKWQCCSAFRHSACIGSVRSEN